MTVSSQAGFDEAALVAQARQGDNRAFAELVKHYEAKIFRLALHITQNREDAEDVLQEAFLKAYEHLDQFQGNSKFYTWIVRIAVNQALMKLRKRRTDKSVSLDETIDTGEDTVTREIAAWTEDPEQRFSREELGEILDTAIDSLVPTLLLRVFVAGRGRSFHRRDRRGSQPLGVGRQEQTVTSAPAVARKADRLFQTQCLATDLQHHSSVVDARVGLPVNDSYQ